MQNKESILITGGKESFIGGHLYKRLKERDHLIMLMPKGSMEWINFEDIHSYSPDIIFHLAAAGSKKGNYSEQDIFETNVVSTWNLLQATRDIPYKAFVNFSSSSCYGIKDHPMREDDNLEPNFLYASTKAAAEMLCRSEAIEHNKPIVTIRPFSIYGPEMQKTKLIPTLFDKIRKGDEISLVVGNHDWTHIDDFMGALDVVVENVEKLKGQAVNIGTGVQTSNYDLVNLVSLIMKKPIRNIIELDRLHDHGHQTQVDSPIWQADIDKLRSLGWEPKISLREGLEKMYEFTN